MGFGHHHYHHHDHFHAHTHADNEKTQQMLRRATFFSIGMAIILLTAKVTAWWISGSLAMLSSLIDSLFDVVSSAVNFCAIRYALKPADEDHRFGHTSIEDIASLGQCAFITASMLLIILQSAERLFHPEPLSHETFGMWVSLGAIILTGGLVFYQTLVTRRSGSLVIASDRLHYAGDLVFNAGVLLALFLTQHFGWGWADPAIAIVIALAVLWSNRVIGIRAFNNLMDREMPDAEKEKIHAILKTMPDIASYHKLKTRYSGTKAFIQMHVEIDDSLDFLTAHGITDRLEQALEAAFPEAEIIIHPDPVSLSATQQQHA